MWRQSAMVSRFWHGHEWMASVRSSGWCQSAGVDGVSPLDGKHVSVPYIGSPAVVYNGIFYNYYQLGQYEQVADNGGIANTVIGQYGNPATVADSVVVDGRIITAENYAAAAWFGTMLDRVEGASDVFDAYTRQWHTAKGIAIAGGLPLNQQGQHIQRPGIFVVQAERILALQQVVVFHSGPGVKKHNRFIAANPSGISQMTSRNPDRSTFRSTMKSLMLRQFFHSLHQLAISDGNGRAVTFPQNVEHHKIANRRWNSQTGGHRVSIGKHRCHRGTIMERLHNRRTSLRLHDHHSGTLRTDPAELFHFVKSLPHSDQACATAGGVQDHVRQLQR